MNSIYNRLPAEFRASDDPEELIKVWRGDKLGRHVTGMFCRLGDNDVAIARVSEIVEGGTVVINKLIDLHTDGDKISPLVSVTTAISRAQGYCTRPDETIYELELPASRLLRDPYHIGSPRKGNDTELFVIGSIFPTDMRAIKTNNHDKAASDLMFKEEIGGRLLTFIANPWLNPEYRHDPDQLPNPAGVWEQLEAPVVL